MRNIVKLFVLFSVASTVLSQPYQYGYYISSPGHYQTLEVNDGVRNLNPLRPNLAPINGPTFRQGRVGPEFGPNRGADVPNFPSRRRIEDDYYLRNYNNPENGIFNQRRDPQDYPIRPDFDDRFNHYGSRGFGPRYQEENFYNPYGRLTLDNHRAIIERRNAKNEETSENSRDVEKEEVTTTESSCQFCGVNKVNSRDGINGQQPDPDSEPVEPKNVRRNFAPPFLVENNAASPPFNNPVVPYYFIL
ncbi:hypothetical protein ABEB36_005795 [Hypothenemus hampei]|uniref:Uncharacterized protein n=1 Tax=Hypothenemus hampei TaxID=57062 RepID=A0ABD1EZG1_HYPHA